MTDEEKAEEYGKGKAHEHYHFLFEENNGSPVDFAKLCYIDGLAEGRKEKEELIGMFINVGLEKEIAELNRDKTELVNSETELKNKITELESQIENMKCCENCKNHYWNYGELDCRLNYSCYNTNYDKWEYIK